MFFKLDEQILRANFRLQEYRRQRLWMQRLWHPELFKWAKGPPPISETKVIRREELSRIGFGEAHYKAMLEGEKRALVELESLVEEHPLWDYLKNVPGFGKYLAGSFIAAGGDITRAPTVSSFWKGMGLDLLSDGTVPRKVKGRKDVERRIPALPHVTQIGEQIRDQILLAHGKARDLYDQYKKFYLEKYPDRALIFNHKAALRVSQKILYACIWEKWRLEYHLPAPWPYAFAILGHPDDHKIVLEDFYKQLHISSDISSKNFTRG